jgi:hypothetical protein
MNFLEGISRKLSEMLLEHLLTEFQEYLMYSVYFKTEGVSGSLTEHHHDKHMSMYSPHPKNSTILTFYESSNNLNFDHLYRKNTNFLH